MLRLSNDVPDNVTKDEEYDFSEDSITLQEDGTFLIRGDADLEDCDAILGLNLGDEEALKEFATLSGFLCMCAGEIPHVGDFVMHKKWCFEILYADDKKILQVKVDRLVGAFDETEEEEDGSDNPLRSFLKRNLGAEDHDPDEGDGNASDSEVENELERTRAINHETAKEVERMVDSSRDKMAQVNEALADIQKSEP